MATLAYLHEARDSHGEWVSVGEAALKAARKMVSHAGLTDREHETVAGEVAKQLEMTPELKKHRISVTVKQDLYLRTGTNVNQKANGVTTSVPAPGGKKAIEVLLDKSLLTPKASKAYNDNVKRGWKVAAGTGRYAGLQHTVAHEFGHVVENASRGRTGHNETLALAAKHAPEGGGMSQYGQTSPAEMYAEAHAAYTAGTGGMAAAMGAEQHRLARQRMQ